MSESEEYHSALQYSFKKLSTSAVDLAQKNEGRKAIGITLLRQKLEAKGIPSELVSMIVIERVSGEHARAGALLQSKFPNSTSRAKAARYLWSRGFEESTIESVIDELHPEPDE
jgi:SOS response regulatory protein OraA/RecX